jgi:hypothetical protein
MLGVDLDWDTAFHSWNFCVLPNPLQSNERRVTLAMTVLCIWDMRNWCKMSARKPVVIFTFTPLFPQGISPSTHWVGGYMCHRDGFIPYNIYSLLCYKHGQTTPQNFFPFNAVCSSCWQHHKLTHVPRGFQDYSFMLFSLWFAAVF